MRKWGRLKVPFAINNNDFVYKIMLHETAKEGVYVYFYTSEDAVFSAFDANYEEAKEALEEWEDMLDESGWIIIEEPLPDCQHDTFLPIRVKGRAEGKPQWGRYEILVDGEWKEYK